MTSSPDRHVLDRPRLDVVHGRPDSAADLVVVAHGGQDKSLDDAHERRPSLLRMWPFVAAAHAGAPAAAVALLRYRFRGWNGPDAHAMADLRTVLDGLPPSVERIVLVGHSMGGRAVLRCGDDPRVVGVLALAPWLPEAEPTTDLRGRVVVTAHGVQDRMTDPRGTAQFVVRLRRHGVRVAELAVEADTHALLHRHGDWAELVRRFVGGCIGGAEIDPLLTEALSDDPSRPAVLLPRWSDAHGRLGAVLSIARARMARRSTRGG
ncbi:MAG TPA: alpha/beta hydrolase [Nocardioidaceae bacterium]|nr:alpha/beta hydrolase [Nocardioidaceae bacterium]